MGSLRTFTALLALVFCAAGAERPPVILVPGLTGSALDVRLEDAVMPHFECTSNSKGKWMNVWVKVDELLPREKDCLLARLTLTYDASTDTYSNLPGVELRASNESGTGLLYKYEFGTMVEKLEASLGYAMGQDLFIAPYDWRLAGDAHAHRANGVGGYYEQLKTLIELSVNSSGQKAVVLSHSLGCPTMLYFFHKYVSEQWRADNIHNWIAVSGPWLGSTMQANAYLGGYDMGEPTWLVPHDYVKPVQVNASSGVWLSPATMAFGDAPIVTTPTKNYTASDFVELISIVGNAAGGEQTVALHKKLSGDLPSIQKPPINVAMHNWYSTGVKTSERYEYSKEITPGFNEAPSTFHYGDGDGIVNHISLKVIETLWPMTETASVETQVFPGATHFGMLSDSRVVTALTDYLNSTMRSMKKLESSVIV